MKYIREFIVIFSQRFCKSGSLPKLKKKKKVKQKVAGWLQAQPSVSTSLRPRLECEGSVSLGPGGAMCLVLSIYFRLKSTKSTVDSIHL